ncbi:leucine-rich repeat domain-containing protein [Metabacillus halosaccharovorans]|uniref:Leucine-rich repeat domain-containing protein n=1 Tax=Metabacillus halosaccharovorans TaxID=930124 RepID=A0ABT3DD39_9BACI|nr:leucine-rich repeat domain-containing protein [Metabacillus halosaccharovorans]MCV9884481.1 leucine-rich repeat domain-containing protein [Metabacillus halosaccharovorans]
MRNRKWLSLTIIFTLLLSFLSPFASLKARAEAAINLQQPEVTNGEVILTWSTSGNLGEDIISNYQLVKNGETITVEPQMVNEVLDEENGVYVNEYQYVDTEVIEGESYTYLVRGQLDSGTQLASNQVEMTYIIDQPSTEEPVEEPAPTDDSSTNPESQVITFNDSNLETALRDQLNIHDRELTKEDLESLTSLELAWYNIEDLSGIEYAVNANLINLWDNQVSDISVLGHLQNLETVLLDNNQVSNISVLEDLPNLVSVGLHGNPLDLNDGSETMNTIQSLQDRGVEVQYVQQEDIDVLSVTESSIEVSWQNLVNGDLEESYEVSLNGELVEVLSPDVTSYTFTDLQPGTEYEVRVKIVYSDGGDGAVGRIVTTLSEPTGDAVTFNDPALEEAVRDMLTIKDRDLYVSDLEQLNYLDALDRGISDLSGLEHANNLQSIGLGYNSISDLTPLAGLTKLEYLDVSGNNLSDIRPLSNLTSLKTLYMNNNQITSIGGLKSLTNLTTLHLSNNNISDISAFSRLVNLEDLNLSVNQVQAIDSLSGLTNLGYLDLGQNSISTISVLEELNSLYSVYLNNNALNLSEGSESMTIIDTLIDRGVDVTYVSQDDTGYMNVNIGNVTETSIELNWNIESAKTYDRYDILVNGEKVGDTNSQSYLIENLSPDTFYEVNIVGYSQDGYKLSSWESIWTHGEPTGEVVSFGDIQLEDAVRQQLHLYSRHLTSGDLERLTYLDAWDRGITDLTGLEHAVNLESLSIAYNSIEDLSPLAELTSLTYLDMNGNNIQSLDSLSGLTNLQTLYANSNEITNLEAIKDLSSLNSLFVTDNQITDIQALASLTALNSLSVSDNDLNDVSVLNELPDLTYIDISYNSISDISVLESLTQLDMAYINNNALDLGVGSISMGVINTLLNRGVDVSYLSDDENGYMDITIGDVTKTSIELNWEVDSSKEYTQYEILIDGEKVAETTNTTYILQGLTPETYYNFEVKGISSDGYQLSDWESIWTHGDPRGDVVNFVDKNLESAVRDSLHLSYRELTAGDLEKLTSLYVGGFEITDITGLEYAINLDTLSLASNQIEDISVLSGLANLGYLDLGYNNISDLSALEGLNNLYYVGLNNNALDLSEGSPAMTVIQGLVDRGVDVEYVNYDSEGYVNVVINGVTKTSVDLSWTIESTSKSYSQFEVYVNGEKVTSTTEPSYVLENLAPETYYDIEIAGLSDDGYRLSSWKSITTHGDPSGEVITFNDENLEAAIKDELYLHYRELTTGDLERITHLDLFDSGIKDLTGLEYAINLERLYIFNNEIVDVTPLQSLTNLEHLELDNNLIEDISPLSGLVNLQSLNLIGNTVTDISPLSSLSSLQDVYLYGLPLDVTEGSHASSVIHELIDRGVNVYYEGYEPGYEEGLRVDEVTENSISISWPAPENPSETVFEVYLNGELVDSVDGETLSYELTGLEAFTLYEIVVEATIASGDGYTYSTEQYTNLEQTQVQLRALTQDGNVPTGNVEFSLIGLESDYHSYGVIDENGMLLDAEHGNSPIFNLWVGLNYEIVFYGNDSYEEAVYQFTIDENHDVESIIDFSLTDVDNGEAIKIADANLEDAIRNELGISNRDLTDRDLESLTSLSASGLDIESLEGLEYAVNLQYLNVSFNRITDLSPLAGLTSLQSLSLWDNKVKDLTSLAGLTNLTDLDLDTNDVTDVSPLSGLTKLQTLWLINNEITDITALYKLMNLENVYVNGLPLDLGAGSENLQTIQHLIENGVYVSYDVPADALSVTLYEEQVTEESVEVSWYTEGNADTASYKLYLNDKEIAEVGANTYSYTFTDLAANTNYEVTILAENGSGYSATTSLDVRTKRQQDKLKEVSFKIVNSEGDSIENKYFDFTIEGTEESNQDIFLYGYTNDQGFLRDWYHPTAEFDIPAGAYEVIVYGNGIYNDTIAEIVIEENVDYSKQPVEITVSEKTKDTTDITIQVTDENGDPVTDFDYASLYSNEVYNSFGYDASYHEKWNVTNQDGNLTLEDVVLSDDYYLTIRSEGFITYNSIDQIAINEENQVIEVTLAEGSTVKAPVVDTDGNPIGGAYYTIYGDQTYEYGQTSSEGINISGVYEEKLTINVSADVYQQKEIEVTAEQFIDKKAELDPIVLEAEKYVAGTVTLDGQPAKQVNVYLYEEGSSWSSYWARTDKNGYFKIRNVPAGEYTLKTEGYQFPNYELTGVQPQEEEYAVNVVTPSDGNFAGTGNSLSVDKKTVVPGKTLNYRLDYQNNGDSTAENVQVAFTVPESVEIQEGSLLVNGENVSFDRDGHTLTIDQVPAGEAGTITFKANVKEDATENIVATADITAGEQQTTFSTSTNVLYVTLQAPSVTATKEVKVYGNAKPGATVQVFDGDTKLAETVVDSRWWHTKVTIPAEAGTESTHQLVAKVIDGDKVSYSAPVEVQYNPNTPQITDATFSAGWNQDVKLNPYTGVATFAIVEFTQIDVNVAFDQEVEDAKIHFLGEEYSLTKHADTYTAQIPDTWSSYGEQMLEISFVTSEGNEIRLPLMEVIVLIDPSGYVFEGSIENRLKGATAVVEQFTGSRWKQWDAEFYGQINPQVTDAEGRYGWDVIQGDWRVIFSKEGYDTYTSRTVVVPPAETQLNVPLVRTSNPTVESITPSNEGTDVALDSSVTVVFDRLMNEENINSNIQVLKDGTPVTGTFTLESLDGYKETPGKPGYFEPDTTKKLSETFVWTPAEELDPNTSYQIVVNGAIVDYNNKPLGNNVIYTFTTKAADETEPGEGTDPVEEPGEETDPVEEPGEGTDPIEEPGEGTDPVEEPGEGTIPADESDNETGLVVKPVKETDSENSLNQKQQEKELPDTATNVSNWLVSGLGLLLIGGILFIVNRRKSIN